MADVAAKLAPAKEKKPIVRSKMVDWYNPVQLVQTGIRVVVSTILGRSSDYRMLEAIAGGGDQPLFFDHTCAYEWRDGEYSANSDRPREQKAIWIDYVSDVGDGFNSTYAIASSVARPELYVKTAE